MEKILLLIVGASIALMSRWVSAGIERETSTSMDLYKQRLATLNEIWMVLISLKDAFFPSIVSMSHSAWLTQYKVEAETRLREFRTKIDQSQVILPRTVFGVLRDIDLYFYDLLEGETKDHGDVLNAHLKKLAAAVNETFSKRTHTIDLELRT